MASVDLLGHPSWYTVVGSGTDTVLLLHGGLSNSDALLDGIGGVLGDRWRVAAFDRRGHGRTADTAEAFHYASMVDETIAFVEHIGAPVHVVGWSDGGIVGLMLTLRRPELVGRLVVIGANFHWNVDPDANPHRTEGDGQDGVLADDPVLALMASKYAERSPDGPDHFEVVAAKSFQLFGTEPELTTDDLARVTVPVLVVAGDDDIIPLHHTAALFGALPEAQLAIVPGASHGLPIEQPRQVAELIERFLTGEVPPQTMMPHRRT